MNAVLPTPCSGPGGKTMSRRRMRRESGHVGRDGAPTYARLAFKAVRIAIGAKLGGLFSMREPIPDRMAELLKLLDQPIENVQDTDEACKVVQQYLPENLP